MDELSNRRETPRLAVWQMQRGLSVWVRSRRQLPIHICLLFLCTVQTCRDYPLFAHELASNRGTAVRSCMISIDGDVFGWPWYICSWSAWQE
jgi:hypothetical protein